MYKDGKTIGVLMVSGTLSMTYKIVKTGNHRENILIKKKDVNLQKKQKKGGSSAARIGRIRDGKEDAYVKYVSEMAISSFMKNNHTEYECEGIIVCGPAELKYKVIDEPSFQKFFSDKIISVENTKEISDSTINTIEYIEPLNKELSKELENIKKLILDASEKLVFGKNIKKEDSLQMIEKVYVDHSVSLQFENIGLNSKLIFLPILSITGIEAIGIRWF